MSYVLVFAPLIGFLLTICFGKLLGDRISQTLTSSLVLVSTLYHFFIFKFISNDTAIINDRIINWLSSGKLNFDWSIYIDPLTSLMLVVITSISFLVHIYSIEYMSHDKSKPRFMAYLSFFTFAMIMLVTADNFVQLFFGWEGVGLALIINWFWYHKNSVTKLHKSIYCKWIGDFGLAIGIFIIYKYLGTLNYEEVFDS